MTDCSVSGCARPAEKAGLCAMHRKRQQRGVGLDAPEQERLSPYERLLVATLAVCDADPDNDQDFALRKRRQGYAVDCVVVERFNQLVDEWLTEGGVVPASHLLARGVQRLLRTVPRSGDAGGRAPRHSEQRESEGAASVAQGRERQPGRSAEGGADRPRRGSGLRSGRDCPTGRPDVPGRKPAGRQGGSRLDSRPRRTAAVLHRARKARVDLP